ncbi:MAG: alpha/beta hydrolase-fold protein [Candidatus Wallbacteria bacterium]
MKNLKFIVILLFIFLYTCPNSLLAWDEEPWSQIEARRSPIKAKRKIEYKKIKSEYKKYSIPFKVILPQGYELEENKNKKYAVVLMLCGASGARRGAGSEPLYFSVWCKLPRVMDNLSKNELAKKDFSDMITKDELAEFNKRLQKNHFVDFITVDLWHPSASRDIEYDLFVTKELLPYLRENYRVYEGREFCGIDGACGGGATALLIAFRNPEFFAVCGGMQTDLGSYPHVINIFNDNIDKIKTNKLSINLNTNQNDVCNSYDFNYHKNGDGTKEKIAAGALAKLQEAVLESGSSCEVKIFKYCSHGYSAYRYPNGHDSMLFYSEKFTEALNGTRHN